MKNRHVLRAINLVRREQETRITCDLTRNTCYADTYETFETLHVPEVSPLLSCPFHLLYGISNFAPGNFSMGPFRGRKLPPTKFPQNVEVISKPLSTTTRVMLRRLECQATACRALSWPSTLRQQSSSDGAQESTDDVGRCETRLDRRRPAQLHALPQCWRRQARSEWSATRCCRPVYVLPILT